eukprot:GHVT01093983.1.p1 GENE.GHVT01093983.1~~GHVT01093983.1.p1  ORF type:complete len:146 (+),score=23.91 GHVT01093983.1:350-787(+)
MPLPELIARMAKKAESELAVERALSAMVNRWSGEHRLVFKPLPPPKDLATSSVLGDNGHIFAALVNDSQLLAHLKADATYSFFEDELSALEAKLTSISETLETIQDTQNQWLLLRDLFTSERQTAGRQTFLTTQRRAYSRMGFLK